MGPVELGDGEEVTLDLLAWLGRLRFDLSTLALVGANAVTIVVALAQKWPLSDVMWVYWGQSVTIGFFQFLRILCLRQFSTEGVTMNDRPVDPTPATKVHVAGFFAVHYGLFHAGYVFFLGADWGWPKGNLSLLAVCLATFSVNHAFSFAHNFKRDRSRRPNIGTVMMFPYARIIPMHIAILTGGLLAKTGAGLLLFLGLKTAADLIMHAIEHAEENLPGGGQGGPAA